MAKKPLKNIVYRYVVFKDSSADFEFLTRSTVQTDKTTTWKDGNEYTFLLDISSASPLLHR